MPEPEQQQVAPPEPPAPEPEPPGPEPLPVLASPAASNGRPRAKERAEAFVREQLANGPRYGELVKRDAAEYAKISERTLIAVGVASIFKLKDLD